MLCDINQTDDAPGELFPGEGRPDGIILFIEKRDGCLGVWVAIRVVITMCV